MASHLRVVILSHRSLFASGIASRLREYPGQVEVHTLAADLPDLARELRALTPAVVIVDTTDADTARTLPLPELLGAVPDAKAILIDPRQGVVEVFSLEKHRAQGVDELIAVMREISGTHAESDTG